MNYYTIGAICGVIIIVILSVIAIRLAKKVDKQRKMLLELPKMEEKVEKDLNREIEINLEKGDKIE